MVGVQRNNDEERAAIVERLLQEHRDLRAHESMEASLRDPDAPERRVHPERRVQPERRSGRPDAELRTEREALERRWNEQHGRCNGERHRENA